MAQLIDIQKVTVGPRTLDAQVEVASDAPFYTSDDPEGTERVLALMPELAQHLCLGDADRSFGNVVRDTEVAHLLEHVTVELVARTGLANRVSSGQTSHVGGSAFVIRLDCPDDVLVTAALASANWILGWAYSGGGEPEPSVDAIVEGLRNLVAGVSAAEDAGPEEQEPEPTGEPAAESEPEPQAAESEPEPQLEDDDEDDDWVIEEAPTSRRRN